MKKYLLVSAMPTPNGELHVGHLAAQFLPLDIFKRYLVKQGNRVEYYAGFDVYDNAVSLAAQRSGRSTAATAEYFQAMAIQQLSYFNIQLDTVIDYLAPDMVAVTRQLINDATEGVSRHLTSKTIAYPYSRQGSPLSGNWVSGKCRHCQSPTKGYSCDVCGISITPDDLYDITFHPSINAQSVLWKKKIIRFINTSAVDLQRYISSQPLPSAVMAQCLALARAPGNLNQWTSIDAWGLPMHQQDEVFFNRNFTLIEQLLISDLFYEKHGVHPFSDHGSTETILAYGKDNAGLLLVDLPRITLSAGLVPPYHTHWVSPFYCLAGEKMSTGRNHALWLSDLIHSNVDADATRLYLCSCYSSEEDSDVSERDLMAHATLVNELRSNITAFAAYASMPAYGTKMPGYNEQIKQEIHTIFSTSKPDLRAYYDVFMKFSKFVDLSAGGVAVQHWMCALDDYFSPLIPHTAALAKRRVSR